MRRGLTRYLIISLFICSSLAFSIYFRITGTPINLRGFYGADPPRYLYYTKIILKDGRLPSRDMLREYPLGRSTSTQLTLFPYTLAALCKAAQLLHLPISTEQVVLLSPILFYLLSSIILFLMARKLYGIYTSLIALSLLGFFPPMIARSMAGFADRDGLVLFLAVLSFLLYILGCAEGRFTKRVFFTSLSSLAMILLGLTWPGVGIFISVIATVELIRMLLKREYELDEIILLFSWFAPICIALPALKETYRFWSKPYVLLALGYPLLLLSSGIMSFLIRQVKGNIPAGAVSLLSSLIPGVALLSIASPEALSKLIENLPSAFGSNPLSETISELQKPGALSWAMWPGIFFVFILAGLLLAVWRLSRKLNLNPWYTSMSLELPFFGMAFSRIFSGLPSGFRETALTIGIFWGTLAIGVIGFLLLIVRSSLKEGYRRNPHAFEGDLLMVIWTLVTLLCMRSAVRFTYLFVVPGAILGSYALVEGVRWCYNTERRSDLLWLLPLMISWQIYSVICADRSFPSAVYSLFGYILLAVITLAVILYQVRGALKGWIRRIGLTLLSMFLIGLIGLAPSSWLGGYGANYKFSLTGRSSFLEELNLEEALRWLHDNTPKDSVVAASWEYGSWINLLAGRATIVDEQQNPYWVYLISRLVLTGEDEKEALRFLKTHGATHLLLTRRDISLLKTLAKQGMAPPVEVPLFGFAVERIRTEGFDEKMKPFYRYLSRPRRVFLDEELKLNGRRYKPGEWSIESIYLTPDQDGIHALVELNLRGKIYRLPPKEAIVRGKVYRSSGGNTVPCILVIRTPEDDPDSWQVLYLSSRARRTISVRLFLLHELKDHFKLVYPPSQEGGNYSVQIWQIIYPEDIQPEPEYLRQRPPKGFGGWISIP